MFIHRYPSIKYRVVICHRSKILRSSIRQVRPHTSCATRWIIDSVIFCTYHRYPLQVVVLTRIKLANSHDPKSISFRVAGYSDQRINQSHLMLVYDGNLLIYDTTDAPLRR